MPELPEVETVRRSLLPRLSGVSVKDVQVRSDDVVGLPDVSAFNRNLLDSHFMNIGRRGKYMLLHLTPDARPARPALVPTRDHILVVHLRMTGRLILTAADEPEFPHTHVVISLDSGDQLRFSDVRRFGRLYLYRAVDLPGKLLFQAGLADARVIENWDDPQPQGSPGLFKLGPEPLDRSFSADYLAERMKRRTASIKGVLLDQGVIAGLGNIYVDEALFRAGIHPSTPSGQLTADQVQALTGAVRDVLREAIAARGTTFSDYRDGSGEPGEFQNYLRVFARTGEPCTHCETAVEKTRVAGRGTHFCPKCQPTASSSRM